MPASPATLRAVIAEDEPLLREELAESIAALWPELAIAAQVGDGIAALRELDRQSPDIMFLDIEMPGMSGLDVARQASGRCHIVFVTAYDQHAITAFEQGAIDYVLKPISMSRLATTVTRLKERAARPAQAIDSVLTALTRPARDFLRWINASHGTTVEIIPVEDVSFFQADSKYTRVVATGNRESLIRKPIKELLDELDPAIFWQIHRSTIVNLKAVDGVVRDLRGRLQVRLKHDAAMLPVSEAYAFRFRQM
jgi:DNA-binding LytR/AlgR family response regulator